MVKITEHLKATQPVNGLGVSHIHPNWGDRATFDGGTIIYYKAGLIIHFDGRDSHFHFDMTEEFSDLVNAVQRGDYDVH